MGKEAPEPPDPQETAQASTSTNVGTAIANAMMGNVSQYGPTGSTVTEQTGTYWWNDPYTGQWYEIPTFSETTTLSDAEQAKYNSQVQAEQNLLNLAANQSSKLDSLLSTPFNLDQFGAMPNAPDLTSYRPNLTGLAPNLSALNPDLNIAPNLSSLAPDLLGKQPNLSALAPNLSRLAPNLSGMQQPEFQTSYVGDFSADRKRVEDALLQSMMPELQRQQEQLRTSAINSGFRAGSEGYGTVMDEANRSLNNAQLQAILAGGQEQSRLADLSRQQAEFGNTWGQQDYANRFTAEQQDFTNRFQAGQQDFANRYQTQQQDYENLINALQQDFTNRFQTGQQDFTNLFQTRQQDFANRYQTGQQDFANQMAAQQQDFTNRYTAEQQSYQNEMANRQRAIEEAFAVRNQPLNEISALLGATQINMPQFSDVSMPTIPTTDVAGLINENYDQQLAAYQYEQSALSSILGGLFGLGGKLLGNSSLFSDRRLKTDIKVIGKADNGLNIYQYRYVWGGPMQIGVMADEVEEIHPDAVAEINGVKLINYERALEAA